MDLLLLDDFAHLRNDETGVHDADPLATPHAAPSEEGFNLDVFVLTADRTPVLTEPFHCYTLVIFTRPAQWPSIFSIAHAADCRTNWSGSKSATRSVGRADFALGPIFMSAKAALWREPTS